jgi:hypothetical protein
MVSIHEAAEFLGVAAQTLRRWEREGKLIPDERTPGGRRRYDLARLRPEQFRASEAPLRTIAYARVSSHDQFDIDGSRIRIPNLGWVRMRETLRFAGKIMSATVTACGEESSGAKRKPRVKLASV